MLKNSSKILEFDKILLHLRHCATSDFVKEFSTRIETEDDFDIIDEKLYFMTESIRIFAVNSLSLGYFGAIHETFNEIRLNRRLQIKNILEGKFNVKKFF